MQKPLDGITVLDFSNLLPGPYCTLILSDMGADIIKVESPDGGDFARSMPPIVLSTGAPFIALNRGKKSITLDLKQKISQEAVYKILPFVDIVVEGFRPGVMKKLNLDYDTMCRYNSKIIYCSISGYGQTGPLSKKAGHDINYLALSGVLHTSGAKKQPPLLSSIQIADIAGGAYPATVAILSSLYQREKTQKGQYLDIAISDGALSLLLFQIAGYGLENHEGCNPGEMPLSGGLLNYAIYETKDNKYISVGALEPKFLTTLTKILEVKDLTEMFLERDEIGKKQSKEKIKELFLSKTRDEWLAIFQDADICCEPLLDIDEVVHHPHHRCRGMWQKIEVLPENADNNDKKQSILSVATPFSFSKETNSPSSFEKEGYLKHAPSLGEHGREIFSKYGFSQEEIQALCESGGLL